MVRPRIHSLQGREIHSEAVLDGAKDSSGPGVGLELETHTPGTAAEAQTSLGHPKRAL
jgi:hypothetical protein